MAFEQTQPVGVAVDSWDEDVRGPSNFKLAIRDLMRRPPALFGFFCLLVIVVWALFPETFAPRSPFDQNLKFHLKPPGFVDGAGNIYLMGTDEQGRDILSRVIYGARVSLIVGIAAVLVSGVIGVTLGLVAGYFGGIVDTVISRIIDSALAVPFILLALAIVAILGPSLQNVILAMSVRTWIVYARVVRGEVLSVRENDYVTSAKAAGSGTVRILVWYLLPNVFSSAIVIGTLYLGRMIIIEASLSFLGLGVPPPTPTWGGMLADGREYLESAWWLAAFPGLALMGTVLGVNLLGDWLRDTLDPRMKRLVK